MSGSKEYFVLVTVILLQCTSSLSGSKNVDLNEVIKSKCSEDGWSLTESESILDPAGLIPTKLLKASSFSCAFFPINFTTSGSLDISVYVESFSTYSGLVIIVDTVDNDPMIQYEYRAINDDFKQGWHIISLPIDKRVNAEVTLLGFSDGEDLVYINTIKYKTKAINPQDWTTSFTKTEILDIHPINKYFDKMSIGSGNMIQNNIKPRDERETNENDFDYPIVGSNKKSGKIQIIQIDNENKDNNNEKVKNKDVGNSADEDIDSGNKENQNVDASNGENYLDGGNAEDGNGEDDNGPNEDGNAEVENGEGGNEDSDGGNGNSENDKEEEPKEEAKPVQESTSLWNTLTIVLVSVGSATALALVLAAAYHLGKIRGRVIPPPIDLSDLEVPTPRIIPRVTSARPYERFGGSEYGNSNPELLSR